MAATAYLEATSKMSNGPSIRDLRAIVESFNQAVEEADTMPDGSPVPDSLEVSIDDILPTRDYNDDFEPATNMCPDCEGSGMDRIKNAELPGYGHECERCNGEGAVFEDSNDDDTDGSLVPDDVYAAIVADMKKNKPGYQPGAMGLPSDKPNQVSVMAWNPETDHEEDMIFNIDTMSFEGSDDDFMLSNPFESINEAATRKDFRMVADLISKIEDPALRQSSAEDHAKMFALQNPRFRRDLFMAACGVDDLGETSDFPAQGSEQECAWWAGCTNDATTTEPHPALGDVPICDRCSAKIRKIEGLDEEETLTELDRDTYLSYLQKATDDAQNYAKSGLAAEIDDDPERAEKQFTRVNKRFKGAERAADSLLNYYGDDPEIVPHTGELELTRSVARQQSQDLDDILGEGEKPYATMKDGPDKYLFRKDQKQKLVGSADNEPEDGEEELEETDMDKFIREMQIAAGIVVEDEAVEEEVVDEEIVDEEVIEEDCDQDEEKNDDGECSPFTHADENVEMVREEELDEDDFGEDLLLAPKGDVGPGPDEVDEQDPWAGHDTSDYANSVGDIDDRIEPELDRQTDFDAPSRYDGDDSYDMNEEPNDDERIIDVGDDEDYETYDFDDEFEQMLGGSSDMPGAEIQGGMYEMNDLRRLAGLAEVMEEEECDEDEDKEELDEIAPVVAAAASGAGAAIADKIMGEDEGSSDIVAYDIADEKVYYVMQDILGAELDFGPEDEILVPLSRNDQVLAALSQQGLEKDRDFCVAGEQYEADLQNGYNDRKFSDGQDYFPKGSHQSPSDDLGPTASGYGDNAMDNRMRSKETDEVYESMKLAYRRHRKA
jgi:hypothetical protein